MAAKKVKKGQKSKGPKVSLSKLSNKRLNKLAKQGKLKNHLKDKNVRHVLKEKTAQKAFDPNAAEPSVEEEVEDIPLEEADYEYFAQPGRDFGFLDNLQDEPDEKKSRKRKRGRDEGENDELERQYESSGRGEVDRGAGGRDLLPIKVKKKVIPRTEAREEETDEDEEEAEESKEDMIIPQKESLPAVSTVELIVQRKQSLLEKKQRMATLACSIIENPEENYSKLRELRLLLSDADPVTMVTVKKLGMVTLREVFRDILPAYRIRVATEAEKQQQAKKETKKLREFEESLLNNYKHYLEFLEYVVKGKSQKANGSKKKRLAVEIPEDAAQSLREVALRCLCELLVSHPHFNFRTNIITIITPYTNHKNKQLSDMVCGYVKQIFRQDRSGEVSLELTRLIGRIIKAKKYDINPKVLNTFLALKIREVRKEEDKPDNKEARREKIRKMSKRERKRLKQMGALEKELQDAALLDNKEHKLKVNTEIVNMIFLSYFRILKHGQDSILLEPVLEGLAKFAHLINVEFFEDLFQVLNELVDSGHLMYRESLHCVQTAFTILSGQGAALNVDPLRFYKHLYSVLFSLHAGVSSEDVPIVLQSLDMMINKRKKQVSLARVLAFSKRLATMSLQLSSHGALATMATIRAFLHHFPKSDILYDTESQGSGVFTPELEDPEHCNAHNTALWELHALQSHYHPVVRQYAGHLAAQAPSQGVGQLPPDLARKDPVALFHEYNTSTNEFKPEMHKKPQGRKQSHTLEDSICSRSEELVSQDPLHVAHLDFHRAFTQQPIEKKPEHTAETSSVKSQNEPLTALTVNGRSKAMSKNKLKKKKYMAYKMSRLKASR